MRKTLLLLPVAIFVGGCGRSGPPSTDTSSAKFATLTDKIEFLQQYVTFRRTYEQLEYSVSYLNNSGGMVPGPSEWDVRIIAKVPPAELSAWTAGLNPIATIEANWLADIPANIDHSGVSEWFESGGIVVGVDREKSVVVYRNRRM